MINEMTFKIPSKMTDEMTFESLMTTTNDSKMTITIRKALGQRNTTKLCLGPEEHCSFEDLDAKTVDGTIRTDTHLALELLGSKGPY